MFFENLLASFFGQSPTWLSAMTSKKKILSSTHPPTHPPPLTSYKIMVTHTHRHTHTQKAHKMWQIQQLGKSLMNSIFSSCKKNFGWMDRLDQNKSTKTIGSYQNRRKYILKLKILNSLYIYIYNFFVNY